MTTLTVRPLRPALSLPSTLCIQKQERPSPAKLSLSIPSAHEAHIPNHLAQPSRSAGTPIICKVPKLSLDLGTDTRKTIVTSGSFSSSRLSSSLSDDESSTSEEDVTSRNTICNTHIAPSGNALRSCNIWTRSYSYIEISGKKSILKGSPSCAAGAEATKSCRTVAFHSEHTVIPLYIDEDEDDIENLSPPSTTSSTDSEESESDSEPKTPVDEEDCRGRSFDRFPTKSDSRNGKWRRPKREWVWTLGGSDNTDIMQELEYSSANLIHVEAV